MASKHQLDNEELNQLASEYHDRSGHEVTANMVQNNGIRKVAEDPKSKVRLNPTFSVDIKAKENDRITDQKHAGFCWMFSTMNVLRHHWIKKYHVKGFELSSNYLFFWDKIERAHKYYLDIIKTADKPVNDRLVQDYLTMPDDDGGEWDMAVSLVEKYGLMPDSVFPRTNVTENTDDFNLTLGKKLRRDGMKLRQMVKSGSSEADLEEAQNKMLEEVYRIVAISVGVPPKHFDFEYRDDKGNYHLDRDISPKGFYQKYFDVELADYVPIANYPHHKLDQVYVQPRDNNVVGGQDVHYLNVPMKVLKQATIDQLKDGEPVWFGNDVGKQSNAKFGLLDEHLYHYDELFGLDLTMNKKIRYQAQQAVSSHAMVFTGVDLTDGQPTKWQVENSWGAKVGESGYFTMSDEWMDAHVDEAIIKRKYLSKYYLELLEKQPVVLQPWE